jgi:hypothetical protein
MKTTLTLFFNTGKRPWPQLKALFASVGCQKLIEDGPSPISMYIAKFGQGAPELDNLRQALSAEGIDWTERREHSYSPKELRNAPLLWLTVTTAQKGLGGPTYGTVYDLADACAQCGSGATQTSPLILAPSQVAKKGDITMTLDNEILVSEDLALKLREASVTGCELRPSQPLKGQFAQPWIQIVTDVTLPPMAETTRGVVRQKPCPVCGRDGYFHSAHIPFEVLYDRHEVRLDSLPDMMHTHERFGNSKLAVPFKESHFAFPLLIVKPRLFDLFAAAKIRGVEFVPVTLE